MGRRGGGVGVDVVVIGAVVAVGVVVAGLVNDIGRVDYSAQIPGCDVVVPPSEIRRINFSAVGMSVGYDNPDYPWFSGPKASAMSDALKAALPPGVDVEFGTPADSLLFEPILDWHRPDSAGAVDGLSGWTKAEGTLIRGATSSSLSVEVRLSDAQAPPCIAGHLDRRVKRSDGTIIDVREQWVEFGGIGNPARTVTAYLTDGTTIQALSGFVMRDGDAEKAYSGRESLAVDELTALVTAPGLRVTAPVPDGMPAPPEACSAGASGDGPEIDREIIDRLNRSLDDRWRTELAGIATLDRPLGSLQLSDFDNLGACEELTADVAGSTSRMNISITGGVALPTEVDAPDPIVDGLRRSTRVLPDGSVVQRVEKFPTPEPTDPGDLPSLDEVRSVTVIRPSGTQVSVSSSAQPPAVQLTLDQLESLATTPGLEL
ncbi:hypothetical protein [Rhodococcus maanshanensis]|uniref:Uncharacterized protein n=1 Tax=Rhodococcus maanshanensis TaxID=183556 RepID=A0A1H7QGP2_9NOCA|nr:hypothetical protein [Rhodococcus maanshanensis]SEL46705.1 hypothetical protein SAMN05444583_109151 [Rhodococcus maanshanensis]